MLHKCVFISTFVSSCLFLCGFVNSVCTLGNVSLCVCVCVCVVCMCTHMLQCKCYGLFPNTHSDSHVPSY